MPPSRIAFEPGRSPEGLSNGQTWIVSMTDLRGPYSLSLMHVVVKTVPPKQPSLPGATAGSTFPYIRYRSPSPLHLKKKPVQNNNGRTTRRHPLLQLPPPIHTQVGNRVTDPLSQFRTRVCLHLYFTRPHTRGTRAVCPPPTCTHTGVS